MRDEERRFVSELEIEVQAELDMEHASRAEEEIGQDPAQWLYDPIDAQRDEVGLRNILGAVDAMEADARFVGPDAGTGAT